MSSDLKKEEDDTSKNSSETFSNEENSMSSHMYWDIIDSDTLSIGRSTPAFIDSSTKNQSNHDSITSTATTSTSSSLSFVSYSDEKELKPFEHHIDGSSNIPPVIEIEKISPYFKIDEVNDMSTNNDSPNLTLSKKIGREESLTHALKDNQALVSYETYSPTEVFDVPSFDTSCFESEDKNICDVDDASSIFINRSSHHINSNEQISLNAKANHISATDVDGDNEHDPLLSSSIQTAPHHNDADEGYITMDKAPNKVSVMDCAQIPSCVSSSGEDDVQSASNICDSNQVSVGDGCCRFSNKALFLHLVLGHEQSFKFHEKVETRLRSSSADEEDLGIFTNGYNDISNRRCLSNSNCESKTKGTECSDQIRVDKGFMNSAIAFPNNAFLKMKEIFFVVVLGNVLFDQKSPLPLLLSHTLAFLVGAFVGKRLSLSHHTSTASTSSSSIAATTAASIANHSHFAPSIFNATSSQSNEVAIPST